jgi:hypothetical protein
MKQEVQKFEALQMKPKDLLMKQKDLLMKPKAQLVKPKALLMTFYNVSGYSYMMWD